MGTRCTITVKRNKDSNIPLVSIYKMYDGYPSNILDELKGRFGNTKIVNGIHNRTMEDAANGIECFAAQVVAFLKNDIGNVYLMDEKQNEYYNYTIYEMDSKLHISVEVGGQTIYDGLLSEVDPNIKYD